MLSNNRISALSAEGLWLPMSEGIIIIKLAGGGAVSYTPGAEG